MTASDGTTRSLDAILDAFGLAPSQVQAFDPAHPHVDAQRPLLILAAQRAHAEPVLAERYPADHAVMSLDAAGPTPTTTTATTTATTTGALASGVDADADPAGRASRAWLVAPLTPEQDVRSLAGLRGIMERLYSPDGCPWDYEQTHASLRGYLIEETYEAIEAIDGGDLEGLCEELGDILLQVFFHAVVAETAGTFTLDDVAETIARKMVRRHPHVFGDAERGSTADEQWTRWDAIKAAERAEAGKTGEDDSPFASLPLSLPALQRAQSVQGRASRAGLADAPSAGEALSALSGAVDGLVGAPEAERASRLGALLWAAAAYARAGDVDAESALREETARFIDQAAPDGA